MGWVGVFIVASRPFTLALFPLAALEDEEAKIGEYRRLLDTLPTVNRATLKALINHLFRYGVGPLSPVGHHPICWGVLGGVWGAGEPPSLRFIPNKRRTGIWGQAVPEAEHRVPVQLKGVLGGDTGQES